ncbi:hypothetical protein SAMN05444354_10561 [Stigmatella aurantiaca]|uniref:Uncharacterized protein n=1 Tax=Stigmatella aurantiaca TaxID=41 RepID=A0A1H7NTH8_STIAU|nr:hypothetical protein [Stigmatella aurantiaca]SEL26609.1 hypothetical protein SAMN05444354_10561 [Stigmatella aurantiaca]
MRSRQGSGAQGGWGRVLLGSTAGLLGALVGRTLARRQALPPSEMPDSLAAVPLRNEETLSEAAPVDTPRSPVVRRGPNGRERYEFIAWEAAASSP